MATINWLKTTKLGVRLYVNRGEKGVYLAAPLGGGYYLKVFAGPSGNSFAKVTVKTEAGEYLEADASIDTDAGEIRIGSLVYVITNVVPGVEVIEANVDKIAFTIETASPLDVAAIHKVMRLAKNQPKTVVSNATPRRTATPAAIPSKVEAGAGTGEDIPF